MVVAIDVVMRVVKTFRLEFKEAAQPSTERGSIGDDPPPSGTCPLLSIYYSRRTPGVPQAHP